MAKGIFNLRGKASEALLDLVLKVPTSQEQALLEPGARAHAIGRRAARQATLLAGSLALPPGFLGWVTLVPELMGVWKIQGQMVADIAAVYGKKQTLGRQQMLHCLFKHLSAQLTRDVVVRVTERALLRQATTQFVSKGAARFVPLIGAVGVGAYAYFDTLQVASTATALFSGEAVELLTLAPGE